MEIRTYLSPVATLLAGLLALCPAPAAAKKQDEVPLTARGKELHEKYTKQFADLRAEVVAAMPDIDEAKKTRTLDRPRVSDADALMKLGPEAKPALPVLIKWIDCYLERMKASDLEIE